jgi:hypothetical protein
MIVLIISGGITISGKTYSTGTRTGPGAAEGVPVDMAAAGAGETPDVTVRVTVGAATMAWGVMPSPPDTAAGAIQAEAAGLVACGAGLAPA